MKIGIGLRSQASDIFGIRRDGLSMQSTGPAMRQEAKHHDAGAKCDPRPNGI
jgi:hypothetical protein